MTYNFDPDKWLDNEIFLLQSRHRKGEIGKEEYDQAVGLLEIRHEQMWKRLDGTYQIQDLTS